MVRSSSSPTPTPPDPHDVGAHDDGATLGRVNPHDGEPRPASEPTATPTERSAPTASTSAEPGAGPVDAVAPDAAGGPIDLDRIGRDLDGVEAALRRLDEGTYWTDEATGADLPDELLAADPVARRVEG